MKSNLRLHSLSSLIVLLIVIAAFPSFSAEKWPTKPITIIYPWGAGSGGDILTRMIADNLQKSFGVAVVVENKAGGTGMIGASYVSKTKPDGYTLLYLSCTAITEKPFVAKVPFDPIRGFTYIAQVADYTYGFAVKADAPWKTFKDFIEDAKKRPGELTVATTGTGSTHHVALVKLTSKIKGLNITYVPYKSAPACAAAVLGKHVSALFTTSTWAPQVDSGELRLLAAPQKERIKAYPNVPTWIELGYDVYAQSQIAFVAPPGLPEEIRSRLEQELKKAINTKEVQDIIDNFRLEKQFKSGKALYDELMKMYDENKIILPPYFPNPT